METKQPRVSGDGLSREEMIKRIYEVIANKDLSFGCRVDYGTGSIGIVSGIAFPHLLEKRKDNNKPYYYLLNKGDKLFSENQFEKVIGHPVMIGDVLERLFSTYNSTTHRGVGLELMFTWKTKRNPIESQTYKCIEYLYSLLETTQPTT